MGNKKILTIACSLLIAFIPIKNADSVTVFTKVDRDYRLYSEIVEKNEKFRNLLEKCNDKSAIRHLDLNIKWYEVFYDPYLTRYIHEALSASFGLQRVNFDLKQADFSVEQNKKLYAPVIDLVGSLRLGRYKDSLELFDNDTYLRDERLNYKSDSIGYKLYPKVTLPVDIWKKIPAWKKLSEYERESLFYERLNIATDVINTVSNAYFKIVELNNTIEIQKRLVENLEQQIFIENKNLLLGLCTKNSLYELEKKLNNEKIELNNLESQKNTRLQELKFLTGKINIKDIKAAPDLDTDVFIPCVPQEISPEVVYNRPDVLKAQSELKQANIDILIAKKAFLPDIKIIGEFGYNYYDFNNLFKVNKTYFSAGATLLQALVNSGQNKQVLLGKKYNYEKLLLDYKETVEKSIYEIEHTLYTIKNKNLPDIQLKKLNVQNCMGELRIAQADHARGLKSKKDILVKQEYLLRSQKELILKQYEILINLLMLCKFTGEYFKPEVI